MSAPIPSTSGLPNSESLHIEQKGSVPGSKSEKKNGIPSFKKRKKKMGPMTQQFHS